MSHSIASAQKIPSDMGLYYTAVIMHSRWPQLNLLHWSQELFISVDQMLCRIERMTQETIKMNTI